MITKDKKIRFNAKDSRKIFETDIKVMHIAEELGYKKWSYTIKRVWKMG